MLHPFCYNNQMFNSILLFNSISYIVPFILLFNILVSINDAISLYSLLLFHLLIKLVHILLFYGEQSFQDI